MASRTGLRAVWILSAAACAGLAAVAAPPARGQDVPPPPPPRPRGAGPAAPLDPADPAFRGAVLGDLTEHRIVGDERVLAAVGGVSQPVWIRLEGLELRCESAVLWGDRERLLGAVERRSERSAQDPDDLLGNVVHAIYAEGKVFVRRDEYLFHADRVLLDFRTHRAYLVEARMQSSAKGAAGRDVPVVVRAAVVRGTARDAFQATDAVLTSCTYEHPHLAFTTSSLEVDFSSARPQYETGWWPTVRADTIVGQDVPLLPVPKLGGSLGGRPVQTFELSNSNRYGVTVGLGFGGEVERADGSTWGTWQVIPRWRSRRGPGLGLEIEHDPLPATPGGAGGAWSLDADWQRDGADTDSFSDRPFDGRIGGDSPPNRGRARLVGRQPLDEGVLRDALGEGWRLDAEVAWSSDRGYLPEYRPSDALTDKQQETFVRFGRARGNQSLSVLAAYRISEEAYSLSRAIDDEFVTAWAVQTDVLPSVSWHLVNEPVVPFETTGFAPLNLSVEAGAANVERRFDDDLADRLAAAGWESERVLRGDVQARVTAPFEIGPLQVTPAFGGSVYRVSEANGYSNALLPAAGDPEGRGSLFHSVRVGAEAHRELDARSDLLRLDGLRHVVSADLQWFRRFEVTDDDPLVFQTNDLHDVLYEDDVVGFRLRNRLQTRRDGEVVDWIDHEARFLWYPDATGPFGGTGLALREDFAAPLDRLDFPGEDKYATVRREGSAFHQHRLRVEATPDLWLVGEADYDMTLSRMESSAAGLRWFPDRRFSVYVGRRTIHDDSSIWTARADYRLSDKWGFTGEFQEETRAGRGLRSSVGLYRRGHDFTVAVEFESERLLEETSFSIMVYPHDWIVRRDDPFSRRRPLDFSTLRWYR